MASDFFLVSLFKLRSPVLSKKTQPNLTCVPSGLFIAPPDGLKALCSWVQPLKPSPTSTSVRVFRGQASET